jgi:hypothetical protein
MMGPGFGAAAGAYLLIPVFLVLLVIGSLLFGAGWLIGAWLG